MAGAGLNTTIEDPASQSNAADDRLVRSPAVAWSVVAVVLVECLYALWTASRGYFWQDDFVDLQEFRQLGLGRHLFEAPVFGHFIPGFTFVDYLISLIVPYPWWLIVLIEVILFGLSLFLLDRLLVTLFGPSWLCVILVAVAGASFSLVPSLVWWATALEYLVAIPAVLLALILHVRYLRIGRVRDAALGAVAIAVGFAFYDGFFVPVLFLVLMTVLFFPVGPGLHGVARTLAVHKRAWVLYGIPVALEIGWRFAHPGVYITGGSATVGQTLGFIGLSWTQTLIPLTFGVDAWLLPSHAERVLAGVLGQIILVAFVVGTLLRKGSAWRAWVLLGSTFLVGATLVGVTRAGAYGPGDASDVKYFAFDAFFLVIAVGFALLPIRPSGQALTAVTLRAEPARSLSPRPARAPRPAWFPALVVLATLAVVLAYGAVLVFDQNRDSESTTSHNSHRFFATFSTSWAAQTSPTSHAFLWNTEINPRVVTRKFFPDDTASVTVGRLHPEIRFDQWSGTGYLLRSDGSVVRATALTEARGLVSGPAACAEPPQTRIVVPLNHRLKSARQWFALVSYRSAARAIGTQSDGVPNVFRKGRGTLITTFPRAPLSSVVWTLQPSARVCITGLKIVLPVPSGTHAPS